MTPRVARRHLAWISLVGLFAAFPLAASGPTNPAAAADAIVEALAIEEHEGVVVGYGSTQQGFATAVVERLAQAGAAVSRWPYGGELDGTVALDAATAYVMLPQDGPTGEPPPSELREWLEARGTRRMIHFHWGDGTRRRDGTNARHTATFDAIYSAALSVDRVALRQRQEDLVWWLRRGEVRVTDPAGTDLRFRVGDRPFVLQDGDASPARAAAATLLLEREIELPAGAVRVAPVESTVEGRIVVPEARFGEHTVRGLVLDFKDGRVVHYEAADGERRFRAALERAPALRQFREFGLGVHPTLQAPEGTPEIPYYGYGAGVVRLSLGDNSELGGSVRGGDVRWMFFPSTTVSVDDQLIVRRGELILPAFEHQ